jgi:inositol phosphorylceramide mannosyltransferase catalytic subunit
VIPHRIIQTGKTRELPPLAKAAAVNLRLLHSDWDYLFFDDRDVGRFVSREFPKYQTAFENFTYPIQRFDFFRYLAVYRLGGFYFDLDVFLSRELSELLSDRCVFPFEELTLNRFLRRRYNMDWEIGNYAFGAEPGHPFLAAVIENCVRAQRDANWVKPMMGGIPRIFHSEFSVLNTTGPGVLSRTYAENPDLAALMKILFPENVCDEATWHKFGSFGVHLMNGSWREKGGFVYRRLAGWWESRCKGNLLAESLRLGPTRSNTRDALRNGQLASVGE